MSAIDKFIVSNNTWKEISNKNERENMFQKEIKQTRTAEINDSNCSSFVVTKCVITYTLCIHRLVCNVCHIMFAFYFICFTRVLADNTTTAITLRAIAAANELMREKETDKLDIVAPRFGSFHFGLIRIHT